ncbi:type II toxin-antitoxin system RelE/ParE family toxin [Photorhabdus sp. APURE]|uniref:type II toxin-antitoxin system RelE/ParE family toxin n=1 Tax=Photorhabdus aballayi TaxID=2991723 RepID=UPI00223D54A0|nr:type II toxin-antitoxin system RelE/ParE family toxin [Photorhabdus aballayi]MCW7549614.1 type II toxin-antitoxin system RelE/ParE family toxin [Photorhabdus aballayi]
MEIKSTSIFNQWIDKLKDTRAKAKIQVRIKRLQFGNFGDVKPVGEGISELRIDEGKGYRIYITSHGEQLIILLCGGDKSTQSKDIQQAKKIIKEIERYL